MSPRRCAVTAMAAPAAVHMMTATTEPSTPMPPPVRTSGPLNDASNSPRLLTAPEISEPKMPPWTKFQAACRPITNHSRRVTR